MVEGIVHRRTLCPASKVVLITPFGLGSMATTIFDSHVVRYCNMLYVRLPVKVTWKL